MEAPVAAGAGYRFQAKRSPLSTHRTFAEVGRKWDASRRAGHYNNGRPGAAAPSGSSLNDARQDSYYARRGAAAPGGLEADDHRPLRGPAARRTGARHAAPG